MKKKITVFLLATVLVLSLFACGNNDGTSENNENSDTNVVKIDKTIDAVAAELGLNNKQEKAYDMVGASDGAAFDDNIQLYRYEDQNSEAYQAITGDGYDMGIAVVKATASNDGMVLVYTGEGSAEIQLVNKFKELQFK